jgi:hypothetical protein
MEERVWLACETPRPMIERLLAHPRSGVGERGWPFSERKLRLWVEACRAHTGDTDDWIDLNNHRAVMNSVMAWADISHGPGDEWARLHACRPRTRAAYLRDVIGSVNNPVSLPYYEPGHANPVWCRPGDQVHLSDAARCLWLTDEVLNIATACWEYAEGGWKISADRLLVLADALEDAKGTGKVPHPTIAHLRGSGPHVRGCWVVDLLLGNG